MCNQWFYGEVKFGIQVRLMRQVRSRQQQRIDALTNDYDALKRGDDDIDVALRIHRKGVKKLAIAGIVSVALRRNNSNVSALDFGSVILNEISRQTVTRCEVDFTATLNAASRAAHAHARIIMFPNIAALRLDFSNYASMPVVVAERDFNRRRFQFAVHSF